MGRLQAGDDLLPALTEFCNNNNIKLGAFSVIGAVTQAKLGYFDQENKQYTGCVELDKKLEIASCYLTVHIIHQNDKFVKSWQDFDMGLMA